MNRQGLIYSESNHNLKPKELRSFQHYQSIKAFDFLQQYQNWEATRARAAPVTAILRASAPLVMV